MPLASTSLILQNRDYRLRNGTGLVTTRESFHYRPPKFIPLNIVNRLNDFLALQVISEARM